MFKDINIGCIALACGVTLLTFANADYRDSRNSRDAYANQMERNDSGNPEMSDQALMKRIHDKIGSGWFSKGYDQVQVQVRNGNVLLQGNVKSWEDKEKVEKEVRDIDGVRNLNSQITIMSSREDREERRADRRDGREERRDERREAREEREFPQDTAANPADQQLNRKIRDAISRGWIWNSYKDISLNTANGVVILQGALDNNKDEERLMNEIQKIEGVRKVKSNLRIKESYAH